METTAYTQRTLNPKPYGLQYEFKPDLYELYQPLIDLAANEARVLIDADVPQSERQSLFFDQISDTCRRIKAGATSWRALDIIYNFTEGSDKIANFWVNMRNAQAVRNRLQLSKALIHQGLSIRHAITERGTQKNPLKLVSIAAGSAQGVIETVAELKQDGIYVDIILIDADPEAKLIVDRKAKQLDIEDSVTFIADRANRFDRYCDFGNIDMIEMLGLLDYLAEPIAVGLCKKIQNGLAKGGYFLTCHIHDNPESEFLKYVIDWGHEPYMYYRTKRELKKILTNAGFITPDLYTEPHQIHSIGVGIR